MLSRIWWGLVRFGFRLLYNELAFTYDWVSWFVSLGQWRCWQRSTLQFLPDSDAGIILELAHGTGNLQIDLQTAGYQTVGFDISPYMGRIAKRKLAKNQRYPDFVRGSSFDLPFADATFTAIVCTFPTDFIVQTDTLAELSRVLTMKGKAIIVLNGVLTGGGVVKTFLEWLYRITGQRDDNRQIDIGEHFKGHGMTVESIDVSCKSSVAQLVILTKF